MTRTEAAVLGGGFRQVCVWEGTIVGDGIADFEKWGMEQFGCRLQYLEEIETYADETGPGGRHDLLFAVHDEDVRKFAVPRLAYGIRWIEDVYGNGNGHLYPDRIRGYLILDDSSEHP